jgi:molecular chaperone DnaK
MRVRIPVANAADLENRYAGSFADGNIFVAHETPASVGNTIVIEFVDPARHVLACVSGEVKHARPAMAVGDRTAGMHVQLTTLDETAKSLAAKSDKAGGGHSAPAGEALRRIEALAVTERAPLISIDGPVVGIDLGTVNSCVAICKDGKPSIIASRHGYRIIPSVAFVTNEGSVLVGHRAVEKMILNPGRAIYGSKRFLGRPYASKEVRSLGHFFTYDLTEGPDGRVAARIGDKILPLEEVSGHILRALKQMAEEELGCAVQRAVITVPAYFGETQRQAVRDAARHAGLYTERILNEPTAAAIAYGWGRDLLGTVLLYDLGGGTFDVALLRIDGERVEVLATDGDPFLGGSDFDDRLTEYVLMRFERSHGINLRKDAVAVQRIRFTAELAKRQLSEAMTTEIALPYIGKKNDGTFIDLSMTLERETLEALTQDLVERTFMLVQKVLDRLGVTSSQLDDVILTGGQTRSPHVRRLLAERFARSPSASVHADEAVALGAAIIADALAHKRPLSIIDVLPASLRLVEPAGATRLLVARGSRLPASCDFDVSPDKSDGEYRVVLCRGESEQASENSIVGTVRMAGSAALAIAGSKANASLAVNAEGILSVNMRHPLTGRAQQMEISLLSKLG